MRKYIMSLFLLFTVDYCFAQELKKVNNFLKQGFKESYSVLKSDKRLKQGEYSLISYGDTLQKGFYTNNRKSGEWQYRSRKKVEFIYNFDLGKIVSDTIGKARSAIYMEGSDYFTDSYAIDIRYPIKSAENGKSGSVIIAFLVGMDGVAKDFEVVEGCGDLALNDEALRVVKIMALKFPWYPAINEKGELIKSNMKYPVKFVLQ